MTLLAAHINSMHGYTYGEQPNDPSVIKLNTNENPYPPSPSVQAALAKLDHERLRLYPNAMAAELRAAIAAYHNVSESQVLVTNGGDEAIRLVATACLTPNSVMVSTEPGYSLYPVVASVLNARWLPMELGRDFRISDGSARRCIGQQARLVCIPNPNAPSGVLQSVNEIDAFASRFKGLLLVDEAYVDFVDPDQEHDLVPLLDRFRHLLLLRTFSKGYSLAGARVGYLLGDASVIGELATKVRDSYNVNGVSQAIALAALQDQAHVKANLAAVRSERERVSFALREQGLDVPESQANFVLPSHSDGTSMAVTFEQLREAKILVRHFKTTRLHNRLRMTIGTPQQNDSLLAALAAA